MVEIWIGPLAIDRTAKSDMNPKADSGTKNKNAATKSQDILIHLNIRGGGYLVK